MAAAVETRRATYYRPELDALRFFSFFCVFLHHGPDFNFQVHAATWKIAVGEFYSLVRAATGFGMSMFFLLSSFLITELLLREKEKYGNVHLKAFYARRVLRIWPLYYLGVFLAVLLGHFLTDYWMPHIQIVAYLLFVVAWFGPDHYTPFRVLWSIGVEEQYYLLSPLAAKLGGRRFIQWGSYAVILLSFAVMVAFTGARLQLWYNPLVEFLFFAVGGLVALTLHDRHLQASSRVRVLLFGLGFASWLASQAYGHISSSVTPPTAFQNCLGYALDAGGTVLIFLAFFGAPRRYFPKWILYLGKISYGLYVFHLAVMELVKRALPQPGYQALWTGSVLAVSLLLTIGIASISYHYFEKPFLRLKARFELVRTC
jgi:peptidoglycan/LPS O-acetylase OafA/YrhL